MEPFNFILASEMQQPLAHFCRIPVRGETAQSSSQMTPHQKVEKQL